MTLLMPPSLETVGCEVCGAVDCRPVLTTHDRAWQLQHPDHDEPTESWTLVRCSTCGLVYLNPRPASADLAAYYPSDYYAFEAAPPRPATGWKWELRRIVRRRERLWRLADRTGRRDTFHDPLTRLVGFLPPGRVLDVGCGSGAFLDELRAFGWHTSGVEPNAAAATEARRRGHDVTEALLEERPFPERSFDVVHLSHVLEHTPSPRAALAAVRRLLVPGGLACVVVPNWASIWRGVFREMSSDLEVPRHFYYFDPPALQRLLIETGFDVALPRQITTPRYIAHSLAVSVLHSVWIPADRREAIARRIFEDEPLVRSLERFAHRLETLGLGNQLLAVARAPAASGPAGG